MIRPNVDFPHGKESVPDRKSRTDQMRKRKLKTEVKDWNSGRFALCIPVFYGGGGGGGANMEKFLRGKKKKKGGKEGKKDL